MAAARRRRRARRPHRGRQRRHRRVARRGPTRRAGGRRGGARAASPCAVGPARSGPTTSIGSTGCWPWTSRTSDDLRALARRSPPPTRYGCCAASIRSGRSAPTISSRSPTRTTAATRGSLTCSTWSTPPAGDCSRTSEPSSPDGGRHRSRDVVGAILAALVVATTRCRAATSTRPSGPSWPTAGSCSPSHRRRDPRGLAGLFAIEADGLRRLAAADALRVPQVIAVSDAALVLEWIEVGPRAPDFDVTLGRQLAALHRTTGPSFGMEHVDRHLSPVVDASRTTTRRATRGPSSTAARRLEPLIRHNLDLGRLPVQLGRRLRPADRSAARAVRSARAAGVAARRSVGRQLHQRPGAASRCSSIPHAHFGHREVDLAMMTLFGGFGPRVFSGLRRHLPARRRPRRSGAALPAPPAAQPRGAVRHRLHVSGARRARSMHLACPTGSRPTHRSLVDGSPGR